METMNNASILEINIIFFVASFGGGSEQVEGMKVQNSLNGQSTRVCSADTNTHH
jgi:hypothetical protein